jgi:hypothetical protein
MRFSRGWLLPGSVTVLLAACASAPTEPEKTAATKGMVSRQDFEIVECLLPGQVRQLGNSTYLTQRRPTRATASECRVRGGEYVAYDRADVSSALRIWMEAAELGDKEAQTNVGEIYERGLGGEPNYEAAAIWYKKAADQGYSRALFNLGTLYEQGKGVQQDKLIALNLYRQAWGLPVDSVIYESAARQATEDLRRELETQIAEKDNQIQLLQKQLKQLQDKLARRDAADRTADAEIQGLKEWIAQLESERRSSVEKVTNLPKIRTPQPAKDVKPEKDPLPRPPGLDFGRYYALVIGNQDYQLLDDLETPLHDASRAARVLADKYGFSVQVLEDANDLTMLEALNNLNKVLKENDNVLIYYAGHGARLRGAREEKGFWLPVNADPPPKDNVWIPNEQISGHLGRLVAKRVLVVADSCFAGLLSADPTIRFDDNKVAYSREYIEFKLPKRSRLLMTSGGDQPVLDAGGGENSVFASAFLDELESNSGILSAPELFARIRKHVQAIAARNKFVQTPEFKAIKDAGHEVGDFFFVPRS